MAQALTLASTGLERLLEEAASSAVEWVNLAGLGAEELATELNRDDVHGDWDLAVYAELFQHAANQIGAQLARRGRLFFLDGHEPGHFSVLALSGPGSILDARRISLNTPVGSARDDDGPAGAADVLALDLGPRDCLLVITANPRWDYTQSALRSASRSGALTLEFSVGHGVPPSSAADFSIGNVFLSLTDFPDFPDQAPAPAAVAPKLIVNLISTLALARAQDPGTRRISRKTSQ